MNDSLVVAQDSLQAATSQAVTNGFPERIQEILVSALGESMAGILYGINDNGLARYSTGVYLDKQQAIRTLPGPSFPWRPI